MGNFGLYFGHILLFDFDLKEALAEGPLFECTAKLDFACWVGLTVKGKATKEGGGKWSMAS